MVWPTKADRTSGPKPQHKKPQAANCSDPLLRKIVYESLVAVILAVIERGELFEGLFRVADPDLDSQYTAPAVFMMTSRTGMFAINPAKRSDKLQTQPHPYHEEQVLHCDGTRQWLHLLSPESQTFIFDIPSS